MKTFVIAGTYDEYAEWLKDSGKSREDYPFFADPAMICGVLMKEPYVKVGEYWKNPIWGDVELKIAEFRYREHQLYLRKERKRCHQRQETNR